MRTYLKKILSLDLIILSEMRKDLSMFKESFLKHKKEILEVLRVILAVISMIFIVFTLILVSEKLGFFYVLLLILGLAPLSAMWYWYRVSLAKVREKALSKLRRHSHF